MARSLADLLVEAAMVGNTRRVAKLLEQGADPNEPNENGTTALYAGFGSAEIVRFLLAAGAHPNTESMWATEGLPLCAAASWGSAEVVRQLLSHGADPNLREDAGTGMTALLWASQNGHSETVLALLDAGADPSAACAGVTALMRAAERGSLGIVQTLLERGADPGATDEEGNTALKIAERWVETDVETELRALLKPADGSTVRCRRTPRPDGTELVEVELLEADGEQGAGVARETGYLQIVELLRSDRGLDSPRPKASPPE